MITNDLLEWDSEDVANLRAWLSTKTGSRFLPKLIEHTPELLASGETNDILIRNGEVRGCMAFARTVLSLTTIPPAPVQDQTAYPSLEDDTRWNDGQQLQK